MPNYRGLPHSNVENHFEETEKPIISTVHILVRVVGEVQKVRLLNGGDGWIGSGKETQKTHEKQTAKVKTTKNKVTDSLL